MLLYWKSLLKWMVWGYPYFRKPQYIYTIHTLLYYTILCYTVLNYTILYFTILYYTILYYTFHTYISYIHT